MPEFVPPEAARAPDALRRQELGLLRERLVAGDSDEEAVAYIVDRYGEYVLLNPPARGSTWVLWAAGPLMLLIAAGVGLGYLRGRAKAPSAEQAPLSAQEQARLDDILKR